MLWRASAIQVGKNRIIEQVPAPLVKYLVFEGGGVRGIAYAGAVNELYRSGMLRNVEHVAGSSIGAVAAMLVAIGCTPDEIDELLGNLTFTPYLEGEKPWRITPELISKGKQWLSIFTKEGYSISSGKLFLEWIQKIIESKLGNKDATFADLAKLVEENGQKYKYLSVTGSNLSKNRIEVFDHIKTPDMSIATAIRISASFPGVFKPVEIKRLEEVMVEVKTDQGIVKEKRLVEVVNVYVDGGLMDNLPYFIFKDKNKLPNEIGFSETGANLGVLNLKIDTYDEMQEVLWTSGQPKALRGLKDFSKMLVDGAQSRDTEIYENYSLNTIQIFDCDIDTLKFNILDSEKKQLVASGHYAVQQWLQAHVSEAYQVKPYENEYAWLANKNVDELALIRNSYQKKLRKKQDELKRLNCKSDDDVKNIEEKIAWLETYMRDKFENLFSTNDINQKPVAPHIDLLTVSPRRQVDEFVKRDMNSKLAIITFEIALLERKVVDIRNNLELYKNTNLLHDFATFDLIVHLSKIQERLRWLKITKNDLLNKTQQASPVKNTTDEIEWNIKERLLFNSQIKMRLAKKETANSRHANLITFIDRHLSRAYAPYQTEEGVQGTFDLRNFDDLKIYTLACLMYLKFIKTNDALLKDVKAVYKNFFPAAKIPTNLHELGNQLNQSHIDLLLSAYRIEGLIKNFIRVDKPKLKCPTADLDYIFAALSPPSRETKRWLPKNTKTEVEDGTNSLELDFLNRPFSHEYPDSFMLFNNRGSSVPASSHKESKTKSNNGEWKAPKSIRRWN